MNATSPSRRDFLLGIAAAVALLALWAIRSVVVLGLFAMLLAYALDPLVTAVERIRLPRKRTVPRGVASAVVVVGLLVVIAWLIAFGAPRLTRELADFARTLPGNLEAVSAGIRQWASARGLGPYVDPIIDELRFQSATLGPQLGTLLLAWAGRLFGSIAQVAGLALLPVLSFYLLAEREAVQHSLSRFLPEEARTNLQRVGAALDRALRSYVRGQAVVCLVVGGVTGAVLAALGFPASLLLGAIAGVAEVIPFVGFTVAAIAIAIAGYGVSPVQAVIGVATYAVINFMIGTWVTPRVMGRHLTMHRFVVTVSILAGAELLGPAGAVLALPGAAVAQALIQEFAARPRNRKKSE